MYTFFLKKFLAQMSNMNFLDNYNSKAIIKIVTRHFDRFLYICVCNQENDIKNSRGKEEKKDNF